MNSKVKCPICLNADFENDGGSCHMCRTDVNPNTPITVKCDVCGKYEISSSANYPEQIELTPIQRAALSHRLKMASREGAPIILTPDWEDRLLRDATLPSPAIQATNIIRYVGDETSKSGEQLPNLPVDFHSIIGAPNRRFAARLAKELLERRVLSGSDASGHSGPQIINVGLTLDGWERYEAEKSGKVSGMYGFIAMKFGDNTLDPFVKDVVKPAVKNGIGYDLLDMRNVARAGIIDNIMRTQIRDAAFVIVDLTHDNYGAYWEAGYAEGLGKPVIYICEKGKFEEAKTHFDTNHCTTVLWNHEDGDNFCEELIATLRRSLDLFSERR